MMRVSVPERGLETLFGNPDENLRFLEETFKVRIRNHGSDLLIEGDERGSALAGQVFEQLGALMKDGYSVASADVRLAAELLNRDSETRLRDYLLKSAVRGGKRVVVPRSLNQRHYLEEIAKNDMVFGIGPAGTGKTYLAMALAVRALSEREVGRIILTRPAVEAGERLGFLPGDILAKVDPYLRPLYDALYDMLDADRLTAYMDKGAIEVAPLAFMRGRTLNDSFIILDEAQNTSPEQMQMFLTRLGFGSRVVVTGDATQIDLPREQGSGLLTVQNILGDIEGIAFIRFGHEDVVRHKIVQRIVEAYRLHAEGSEPGHDRDRDR